MHARPVFPRGICRSKRPDSNSAKRNPVDKWLSYFVSHAHIHTQNILMQLNALTNSNTLQYSTKYLGDMTDSPKIRSLECTPNSRRCFSHNGTGYSRIRIAPTGERSSFRVKGVFAWTWFITITTTTTII